MPLQGQKITNKNFTEKMTQSRVIQDCEFNNVKFDQICWGGLTKNIKWQLTNVTFNDCHFKYGSFCSCSFDDVSFRNCVIAGVSFDLCSFKNTHINSKLEGVEFERKVKMDNYFNVSIFRKEIIVEREFGHIDFSGSTLRNISFIGFENLNDAGTFKECFVLRKEHQSELSSILKSNFGENELTEEISEILFRNIPFSELMVLDFKNFRKKLGVENLDNILDFLKNDKTAMTLIEPL